MTGEELDKKVFEEVLNLEEIDGQWYQRTGSGAFQTIPLFTNLPPLHKSLDLQEEWVWPELRKLGIAEVEFNLDGFKLNKKEWWCSFVKVDAVIAGENKRQRDNANGETKAIAQLTAALKALGKL